MFMASNFSLRLCLLFLIHFGMCFARFSDKRCDDEHLFHIIKFTVWNRSQSDPRLAAALLRLHFHDCFVNGCDGSVLLDSTDNFRGERMAKPNRNSLLQSVFTFINDLKTDLNQKCGNQRISCADVVAVAARDAVVLAGGPDWNVLLGRNDSTYGNITTANTDIPAPTFNRSQLIQNFKNKKLNGAELVALSGGHTFGVARCVNYAGRIFNATNINPGFAAELRKNCSNSSSTRNGNVTAFLDITTPRVFDNAYYKNLMLQKGLLSSDQQLFNTRDSDEDIDETVKRFANNQTLFFEEFAKAMVKMSKLKPTILYKSEIRINCSVVNS